MAVGVMQLEVVMKSIIPAVIEGVLGIYGLITLYQFRGLLEWFIIIFIYRQFFFMKAILLILMF